MTTGLADSRIPFTDWIQVSYSFFNPTVILGLPNVLVFEDQSRDPNLEPCKLQTE